MDDELDRSFRNSVEQAEIDKRHREFLKLQEKHHKELLEAQNKFNKKLLSKYGELNKWTKILAFATICLCLFALWTSLSAKYAVDLQAELYSPKIKVQLTADPLSVSHYVTNYTHKVWQSQLDDWVYYTTIYIELNNHGLIPFQ